ncbi:MAG: TetR/AcrR family transcriptional regulator [Solirubrobacteraceae bacterium]
MNVNRGGDVESRRARRPYLRAADRRRQLLDAAMTIAGRDGIERITMVAVAAEAGVSRQLLYEHFSDLETLVVTLLLDRFAALDATISAAIVASGGGPTVETALTAARLVLSLPAEQHRVLRSLLVGGFAGEPQLAEIARRFRERATDRWSTVFGDPQDPTTRGLAWAMVNSTLAVGDLVDGGTLTIDEAAGILERLVAAARS